MPTTEQAELSAGRTFRVNTATHGSAPTNGVTEPDLTLSPVGPGGFPTIGFLLGLTAPSAGSATAGGGGFTVTIYWRDPVLKRWFSFSSTSVSYGQLFGTSDLDAGELYIQIGNVSAAGLVDVTIAEQ